MRLTSTDVIIVGGGVSGLLSALFLSEAGVNVTVIERGDVGQESSWAGGGILSPLYSWKYPLELVQLCLWSQKAYPSLVKVIHEETGIDPEWRETGLWVFDQGELEAGAAWAHTHHVRCDYLDAEEVCSAETQLQFPKNHQALSFPDIAQLRNPRFMRALKEYVMQKGVQLKERTCVDALRFEGQRVVGVQCGDVALLADSVLVTAGAWSADLFPADSERKSLPVAPVRGQMLLYHCDEPVLNHIVLDRGHYLIPRVDGHVLIGSTVENVGFDKSLTPVAYEELKAFACSLLPCLEDIEPVCQWAGLRPGSPRGIPFISEHPHYHGLFVNAGHYRNGFVSAPASARLAVDLIMKTQPLFDPASYSAIVDSPAWGDGLEGIS